MKRRSNIHRIRRGAAVVETAIIVPVLMTLAFGCTDFGRVFHAHTIVSNAARCGAEYGSLHNFTDFTRPSWETAIRGAVEADMQSVPGFQASRLTVDIATTTDADGLFRVAVQVTYPFDTVVAWPGIPSTIAMTHRVEMRRIH